MSGDMGTEQRSEKWLRGLLLAVAITTFLMMMAGTVVRTSGSSLACPDWPTCFGLFGLPDGLQAQIQVAHRALAALASLLTVAAAAWAGRRRAPRGVRTALALAAALMLAQAGLGAALIDGSPAAWLRGLHLAMAMAALALQLTALVQVYSGRRLRVATPFTRLSLLAAASILVLTVSGLIVTVSGAGEACSGWPLCAGGLPASDLGWLALAHRIVTGIAAAVMVLFFQQAWKTQRSQDATLTAATTAFFLFAGQALIGALKVTRGFPLDLIGLHAAANAGVWAAVVVAVVSVAGQARSSADEAEAASLPIDPFGRRARSFILLNKPIIVLLLLVTTYAGMVVGGKSIPPLGLTLLTLVGGALAAGGSSALNQYIDRQIDGSMQRTAKRPLPAGRLTPAEALAYGAAACLTAFFLLAGFVNLLAAVLSLAGMIYYVLIYSIWLKHATVQNIVIGGGAGAIPPLVGWAAVTGSLNIPSLFLFALIFLWTPPHFWALALVRQKDYARAGVPMLPVVKGERETRVQIFVYTLELVGLTLLMPLFKITGSLFLVSAVALGLWLIWAAWKVLRHEGNKVAWTMYRYSSMYLAFIMLALVIDVLV